MGSAPARPGGQRLGSRRGRQPEERHGRLHQQVEEPRERDGLYEAAFSKGAAKGMSWFGANGKACAVTTVIGKSVDDAKVLLKGLKPVDASLFPKF